MLLVSALAVSAFAAGLMHIQLTTDPVELWSAPNSRARQEKDFHDTHFGPFFRTNQLILTAPNTKGYIYDSLLFGKQNFSGLVSKDLIIQLLELQTRIRVINTCSHINHIYTFHTHSSFVAFLGYRVFFRRFKPHRKFEGCVFCSIESVQPQAHRLRH